MAEEAPVCADGHPVCRGALVDERGRPHPTHPCGIPAPHLRRQVQERGAPGGQLDAQGSPPAGGAAQPTAHQRIRGDVL